MKTIKILSISIITLLTPYILLALNIMQNKNTTQQNSEQVMLNQNGSGMLFNIGFLPGKAHNHPTIAVWIENIDGSFIQPLFITKAAATGIFQYGQVDTMIWKHETGEAKRPAAIPYFFYRFNTIADNKALPSKNNPIPDAFSSATPKAAFTVNVRANNQLPQQFKIMVEINQTWDWNPFWNNTKFIDDIDYKHSCQPALIYSVTVNQNELMDKYYLNPVGHSHYSGKDGKLYTDISTFTTALHIFDKIILTIEK